MMKPYLIRITARTIKRLSEEQGKTYEEIIDSDYVHLNKEDAAKVLEELSR